MVKSNEKDKLVGEDKSTAVVSHSDEPRFEEITVDQLDDVQGGASIVVDSVSKEEDKVLTSGSRDAIKGKWISGNFTR